MAASEHAAEQTRKSASTQAGPATSDASATSAGGSRDIAGALASGGQIVTASGVAGLQRLAGNRAAGAVVQTKLTVGAAGDAYEQEADRVAGEVMRTLVDGPPAEAAHVHGHGGHEHGDQVARVPMVNRKVTGPGVGAEGGTVDQGTDASIRSARGGGRPLEPTLRRSMERGFGADFSEVRVHTDAELHQANETLQAKAFTTGSDIFFRDGQYDPSSRSGQALVAHELTHVVQQGAASTDVARSPVRRDVIQRHGEGEPLLPAAPDAVKDLEEARKGTGVPPVPTEDDQSTTPQEAPTTPVTEAGGTTKTKSKPQPPPDGEQAKTPGSTPKAETPKAKPSKPKSEGSKSKAKKPKSKAKKPKSKKPKAPAPIILTGTMSTAFAQKALTDTFGKLKSTAINAGNITVVANSDELYAAYDKWCIDHGLTRTDGTPWQMGDKKASDGAANLRTNAFAEPAPGTNIWVDATGTDPTATVHEMMHINTAAGFRAAVGEVVNEGATQWLSTLAVSAAGESVAGSERTYQSEQKTTKLIAELVTLNILANAYFKGASMLVNRYNTAVGDADGWATLKTLMDARDFTAADELLKSQATQRDVANVKRIIASLKGIVSDKDLGDIKAVYDGATAKGKAAIRAAIEPRTHGSFWRSKTRARVREIIEAK